MATSTPSAVILTALPVEYQAVRSFLLDLQEKVHKSGTIYEVGTFQGGKNTWTINLGQIGAGNQGAASEVERAIEFFNPNIVLFIGIAGGVKDVAIGDVVIANKIYGYESGKWDREGFMTRPDVGQSSYRIIQRAQVEGRTGTWKQRVSTSTPVEANTFVGAIAAGEKVIASTQNETYQLIRSHYNDVLAVEMEGIGFLKAVHTNDDILAVVIRGISDLLDNKQATDRQGSQALAAKHASAFAFELLATLDLPERASSLAFDWETLRPSYPRLFVGRDRDLMEIKGRLGVPPSSNGQPLTVIRGWPGVGKTTLIYRLLHDKELENTFKDGIFWANIGPQETNDEVEYSSTAISEIGRWARELGIPNADKLDLDQLIRQIQIRWKNKHILLVVDDIWRMKDGELFQRIARNEPGTITMLMTTRFKDVAEQLTLLPSDIYWLRVLTTEESLELIRLLAPNASRKYESKLRDLVESLEGLPLALRVAGSLIEKEASLGLEVLEFIDELTKSRNVIYEDAPSDRIEQDGTTPTIRLLLKRSVDTLNEVVQEYFAILGAFAPRPATFDLAAMKFMWEVADPIPTMKLLVGRGLLEPLIDEKRFQMHATLQMYAESMLEDNRC